MKPSTTYRHGFIIGAPKCGTTSLANWLDQHPQICMSRPKESKFFTSDYVPWGYESGYIREYFRHFENEKILVDANPMLMMPPFVPERIVRHINNSPKFVAMVREPIERMYSHWRMDVNMSPGRAHKNFSRALSKNLASFDRSNFEFEGELPFNKLGGLMVLAYIEYGLYYDQLSRYADIFGWDSIMVVSLDDISKSPKTTFREVCEFFEVEDIGVHFTHKNSSLVGTVRAKFILENYPESRKLIRIFEPQIEKLSERFNRDFRAEWWG